MDWQSRLESRYQELQKRLRKKNDRKLQERLKALEAEYFHRCRQTLPQKLQKFLSSGKH